MQETSTTVSIDNFKNQNKINYFLILRFIILSSLSIFSLTIIYLCACALMFCESYYQWIPACIPIIHVLLNKIDKKFI